MTTAHGTPDVRVGGAVALPRPPGVLRRFTARHPRLVDWTLAIGTQLPVLVIGVILAAFDATQRVDGLLMAGVALVAGAALLWRRRWPLLPTLVCAALLTIPSELAAGGWLAIYVALYSVGAYGKPLHVWIGVAAATAGSLVGTLVVPSLEPLSIGPVVSINLVGLASYVVAVLLGTSVRGRRAYVAALIARADDLAREREKQAQLAVAAERSRIAREMHDVVSHGLTVMVTLAEGSAAQAARDPERAADTMRRVADTGRDSLAEMRRLLGVLREPGDAADRAPQPAAGDLHALVASFRDVGMPVRLTTSGAAIADQTLALTVHRIVQEALTNAMRHASDAARVEVDVRHGSGVVRVEVVDDGTGAPAATTGAGRGLVGMRERVALFAGDVVAGPREPTGWRVVATLHETPTAEQEPA
ncbi:sensor histidine kinase [Agrococcus jejuensis]|uniref:histidine kinase n=1 Tax=Agrococcus jejuensis TaxID=399736 RepID=A0A1G8AZY8_9MICO|nr:histidine kinase [Agrococcus jejuensis]SDH26446.1 Signal transduction histidine kinase [Agrococcus jejuensis]